MRPLFGLVFLVAFAPAIAQNDCLWKRGKLGTWSECTWMETPGIVYDMRDSTYLRDTTHVRWMKMRVVQLKCIAPDGRRLYRDKRATAIDYQLCP